MDKMLTIFRREYFSRLKTKGFIIGTILTPVLLLSFRLVPEWLMSRQPDESKSIAVIDLTHETFDSLRVALNDKNENGQPLFGLFEYKAPAPELETAKAALTEQVVQGALDSYIIIPATVYEDGKAEYYGKSVTNFRENSRVRAALTRVVTERRIRASGLHSAQVHELVRRVPLRTVRTTGGQEQEETGQTEKLVWLLVMLIYMAMIVYGQIVMRSVIEEKSSRVIESVISSVKPFQLMAGKIFGIGALGLTQYLIWVLVLGVLPYWGGRLAGMLAGENAAGVFSALPQLPMTSLAFFIIFFVLGYFLFAAIYAGVGAMVNSEQEAQQLVLPVVMLVVIPLLFTFYIIGNPNSRMAVILSLIPFFAPLTMFARILVLTPPAWQIALSLGLLVVTILGMIWLVGRIYRVGVLMYGKRPTLPEVIKWIRYA